MIGPLIQATWDLTGEFATITYTVSGLPAERVERLHALLAGDRRQRKRGMRLITKGNSFFPARQAKVVLGDEVDTFLAAPFKADFIQELKAERLLSACGWRNP